MKFFLSLTILQVVVFSTFGQLYKIHGKNSYGLGSNITMGIHLSKSKKFWPYIEANLNSGYLYSGKWMGITPQIQYAIKWNTFSTLNKKISHQLFGSLQVPISLYHSNNPINISFTNYNQPFYAFADLSLPAIKNLYRSSFAFGTQFIVMKNPNEKIKIQQVGSINLKLREVHVFYQNDGVLPSFIIDGHDRWFTSSAMVAWHKNSQNDFNHYSIAYNRFTGHTPLSYEVSKVLGNNYVDYKDMSELKYNEDYWRITLGHNQIGTMNFNLINANYKLIQGQKAIHYLRNMPYHLDNSPPRISLSIQTQVLN